jgi:RNA polymerase sigma-54 factor
MPPSTTLNLKQTQSHIITPQLQQAIKLLQLSSQELESYIADELEKNPLLQQEAVRSYREDDAEQTKETTEDAQIDFSTNIGEREAARQLDTDLSDLFPECSKSDIVDNNSSWASLGRGSATSSNDATPPNLEAYVSTEVSLRDHLGEQLMFATSDPANRIIGQYLIDMVDEDGYLRTDLPQLCVRLGASENTVMETLKILQGFDPVGVMARNLQECMEIQLKDKGRFDPEIAIFIQHLDLLAAHDFPKLKKLCNCDDEDIADMIAEVRNLDPRPGLAFGTVPVQPVIPDVKVYQRNDGSWHVELNTGVLPRVLVNQVYYTTVSKNARSRKEKEYISQCMQNASWLVKSLDQRARTILKVSEEIVRQQDGFFVHGVEHLRPLNLKDVANAISMHESTVSRVTSNKYMATTRGIFELKYFFTSAVTSSEEGAVHSSEAVRHKIKVLIDNENPGKVLSDNKIVEILKADDIEIARRTVAKYREAMRIPSSVQRRREKKLR